MICPNLIVPTNGAVTYSDTTIPRDEGSTVAYSCYTGYVFTGNSSMRTCTSSGWSGSDPLCTGTYIIIYTGWGESFKELAIYLTNGHHFLQLPALIFPPLPMDWSATVQAVLSDWKEQWLHRAVMLGMHSLVKQREHVCLTEHGVEVIPLALVWFNCKPTREKI